MYNSELGWPSLRVFIDTANISCNWLVLRNYEYLPDDFFGNDDDIDILCDNPNVFSNKMKLQKRSWGISSYKVLIDGIEISVDLRSVGDQYYDKLWQHNMLKNKIFTSNNVPCPSPLDMFYSLLYHSLLQKKHIKNGYLSIFSQLSKAILPVPLTMQSLKDNDHLLSILSEFMRENNYTFTKPFDSSVYINQSFLSRLPQDVVTPYIENIPPKHKIMTSIPIPIKSLIPIKLKNFILNLF